MPLVIKPSSFQKTAGNRGPHTVINTLNYLLLSSSTTLKFPFCRTSGM